MSEQVTVQVINRVTRAKRDIPIDELQTFLRKHTLFEEIPKYVQPPPKKPKQKPKKQAVKVKLEQENVSSKYAAAKSYQNACFL